MKKIAVLVIILIIFNFICTSYVVYADPSDDSMYQSESFEEDDAKQYLKTSDVGSASSRLGEGIAKISGVFTKFIGKLTGDAKYYRVESQFAANKTGVFTVNSLVFGEYLMFYAKPYQKSTDLLPGSHPQGVTAIMDSLKTNGMKFSNTASKVGIALALPLMLFSLVKIAIANKASDLAAWKKIALRWVLCILLLSFFQYILIAIDLLADTFIDIFWKTRISLENGGYQSFESTVIADLVYNEGNTGGVLSLAYAFVFFALVVMQMIFFGKYMVRAFAIIFLFILAPIVMLMHSFNLMLGKTSNMLGQFFKNYTSLVFMQPLHALFYLIFFFSFSEMVIKVPILGIILLYALYRAVDIIKAMFGWELGSSIFSFK